MVRRLLIITALCATLAACESSEERAERHYQSALALLAEGELERALVELRNVFDFNGFHREARQLYAETVLQEGQLQEAYSQYLRLVEQYPDDLEARLTLTDLALRSGNWDEVVRHGSFATELAPDDPRSQAVATVIAYREAVTAGDEAAKAAAAAAAAEVLAAAPESQVARRVVIDAMVTGPDPAAALPEIERALEIEPDAIDLQSAKLRIIAAAEPMDPVAVGAQMERMLELFPETEWVQQMLLDWYRERGDLDAAEALLRRFADGAADRRAGQALVVRFLSESRGPEAARAELERLVAAEDTAAADRVFYRTMLAGLTFDAGERDRAIADLQAMLQDAEASAEASDETRQAKTVLARMLLQTGNPVGARALVEEVLEVDDSNVPALKMRAAWAIEDGRPLEALADLNTALSQAPQDPETILLMAEAYERDGNIALTGERLALAAETAGYDPAYAMRYAQFLLSQGRTDAARSVLDEARRARPGTPEVLQLAGRLALEQDDPTALDAILAELDRSTAETAPAVAMALRTGQMLAAGQTEATAEMLEAEAARGGEAGARAAAMLAVTRFQTGDPEGARAAIDRALAELPDNPELIVMSADLHLAGGDVVAAQEVLRQALEADPGNPRLAARLYEILAGTGEAEVARQVLAAALESNPDSPPLNLLRAYELETAGDYQGAIAVYEEMYARDESNLVVANNLASLLATYDPSPEALERAEIVGRRLRARPVPALQDTWGWIAYRRGNFQEALAALEPAAVGLPDDPMVQYHLGMAYLALDRTDRARDTLARAVELAGEDDPRPQIAEARALLAELSAEPPAEPPADLPADGAGPDDAPAEPTGVEPAPADTPADPPATDAPADVPAQ